MVVCTLKIRSYRAHEFLGTDARLQFYRTSLSLDTHTHTHTSHTHVYIFLYIVVLFAADIDAGIMYIYVCYIYMPAIYIYIHASIAAKDISVSMFECDWCMRRKEERSECVRVISG